MEKKYLGDSVYYQFDGYHVVLTTENGFGPSNQITLELEVLRALISTITQQPELKGQIKVPEQHG